MEKNVKFILTVLLIASTIFLSAAVALFFMRQAELEKRQALEKRIGEVNKEKAKLTNDLDEVIAIKGDLEARLGAVEEKARLLEGQLSEEKKSRQALSSQLEGEKRESRRLVDELMRIKDEKESISLSLANAKSECEVLKVQMSNIQLAKEVLENKLQEILSKKEVELEKIVVSPVSSLEPRYGASPVSSLEPRYGASPVSSLEPRYGVNPAVPHGETAKTVVPTSEVGNIPTSEVGYAGASDKVRGEVLVVNKKFDFVVVSLGEDAGMRPGANVGVYRNGQFLASLQIEKVHANMSAAKIPPEAKDVDIREGDEVACPI